MIKISVLVFTLYCASTKGHVAYWNTPNVLQPVHGLFVKPSSDGTTGDLYVAASEDNGVKSQWLTDQPVNFLPVAASTTHQTAIPYTSIYPPPSHEESINTQKRAVMPNPPIQYAYALPVPSGTPPEGIAPYTYTMQAPSSTPVEGSSTPQCVDHASVSQYSPYQFFYPQMMSAYANALSILKDAGLNDDTASAVMAQHSPTWPPASYAYPMYVMMDPNTWAASSTATQASPSTSPASATSSENTA